MSILRTDLIYEGKSGFAVRAMFRSDGSAPVLDWIDRLERRGKGCVIAACRTMESTVQSERPLAGRARPVRHGTTGLWELRATCANPVSPSSLHREIANVVGCAGPDHTEERTIS